MEHFAFLEKPSAVNLLKQCQIFLAKSSNAMNDSINLSRDNLEQNKIFKKFIRSQVNTFAANYEFTCSNLLNLQYIQNLNIKAFADVFEANE